MDNYDKRAAFIAGVMLLIIWAVFAGISLGIQRWEPFLVITGIYISCAVVLLLVSGLDRIARKLWP